MFCDADHAVEHGHDQWRVGTTFDMNHQKGLSKAGGNVDHNPLDVSAVDHARHSAKVEMIGADQEADQATARLVELEASLLKAQRRIERLLGERNQLSALLDKRDAQIQALNRELGPRYADSSQRELREAVPSVPRQDGTSLISRVASLAGRFADLWPTTAFAGKQQEAEPPVAFRRPPLIANFKDSSPKAVLAVIMFGLDQAEMKSMLPVIERDGQASGMMPLVLTDNDAFELLRDEGMIFEYLPSAEDRERFSKQLSWDLYLQRRLAIIRQKWQPARVIALGQVAGEMLRLWEDSPFEELPLPSAAKGA
ncbi:MAG: hypothetical protein ACRBM6_21315 [Geminicoccales bacterium]